MIWRCYILRPYPKGSLVVLWSCMNNVCPALILRSALLVAYICSVCQRSWSFLLLTQCYSCWRCGIGSSRVFCLALFLFGLGKSLSIPRSKTRFQDVNQIYSRCLVTHDNLCLSRTQKVCSVHFSGNDFPPRI